MTGVTLGESLRYAGRLFAVLVGVTVLGGAGVALGLALGWPGIFGPEQLVALLGSGSGGLAYSIAGGVLVLVGGSILAVGYIAATHKLLADAVVAGATSTGLGTGGEARGVPGLGDAGPEPAPAEGSGAAGESSAVAGATDAGAPEAHAGTPETDAGAPEADAQARESGPDDAPIGGEGSVEPAEAASGTGETEDPPEPTPEEIAFGTSAPEDEVPLDDEPVEEPEETTGGDVRPAASNASSDPLADPTDDG